MHFVGKVLIDINREEENKQSSVSFEEWRGGGQDGTNILVHIFHCFHPLYFRMD